MGWGPNLKCLETKHQKTKQKQNLKGTTELPNRNLEESLDYKSNLSSKKEGDIFIGIGDPTWNDAIRKVE